MSTITESITNKVMHCQAEGGHTALTRILVTTLGLFTALMLSLVGGALYHSGAHAGKVQQSMFIGDKAAVSDLRAHESKVLNSFEVVDAGRGVYRIPIDRAMELMAKAATK